MKLSRSPLLSFVLMLPIVLPLAGCGLGNVLPSTQASTSAATLTEGVTGNVYGGHAPLVGAHIYLVQPTTGGYGSVVTNLLGNNSVNTSTSSPAYTLASNVNDQFVPSTSFKYVTTDSNGQFNVSGTYTCTAGLPVILIAYGGAPSYVGVGPNAYQVTNVNVAISGTTATYTFTTGNAGTVTGTVGSNTSTFTASNQNNQLFYAGEQVTFGNLQGGNLASTFNGTQATPTTYTVSAANQSTGSFQITYTTVNGNTAGNYSQVTNTYGSGAPTSNPAAVNMATLGNCPSSGSFSGASALPYLYVNEISTLATAYAFVGYTKPGLTPTGGFDEFHISTDNINSHQGTTGIANAALTAAKLYDNSGGNISSGPYDGPDAHVARTTTPSGYGSVSNTMLNTLGNILAACTDSQNTYRVDLSGAAKGTQSSQCQQLGIYATDSGVPSNAAVNPGNPTQNNAQAAFSLAYNPQIDGATSVAAVFNIPSSQVPFAPNLASAPNDFSVVIGWSFAAANMQDVEIDSGGNVWAATRTGGTQVYQLTPAGVLTGYTGALSTAFTQIAIDSSDNVWVPGTTGALKFVSGTPAGTLVGSANATSGGGIATDGSSNQYIANKGGTTTATLLKQSSTGASSFTTTSPSTCVQYMDYVTVDQSQRIWAATTPTTGQAYVCLYSTSGSESYLYKVQGATNTAPHFIATDAYDELWFADQTTGTIYTITVGESTRGGTPGTPQTPIATATPTAASSTGGSPIGVVIDGNNSAWFSYQSLGPSNVGGVIEYYSKGQSSGSVTVAPTTPTYITGGALANGEATRPPLGAISADPSGNLWVAGTNNLVYEYVGLVVPTQTSLTIPKVHTPNGNVGTRP